MLLQFAKAITNGLVLATTQLVSTNPYAMKINIALLKQYMRTLVVSQDGASFIQPRSWGDEFTKSEMQTIYQSLKFVLGTATTRKEKALRDEFEQAIAPAHMHWFLLTFYPQIVYLLEKLAR